MASIGIGIVKMSAKLLVLVLLRRFPEVLVLYWVEILALVTSGLDHIRFHL